ncbi:L-lactate dehydrogenase [uncultured Sphingomonas sp.]|uniref:L-lactate dehydrogenase n=1 Tax=uncultured Sphingomonas sp. TaxID=158754 RepID=UPI0035CBAF8C
MKQFEDYLRLSRRRLPHFLFEYVNGGTFDEVTLRANRSRLAEITLRQRVMRDMSEITTATTLLGESCTMPVVLSPVGLAGMTSRRGEIKAARAAKRIGIPYCMSTYSLCPIAEVGEAIKTPFWFQLNMFKDRGFIRETLAEAARYCSTLIFNADLSVLGTRYRDYRTGLFAPAGLRGHAMRFLQAAARPGWSWDVGVRGRPHGLGNIQRYLDAHKIPEDTHHWTSANIDPSTTWRELAWIREQWTKPLVIKGILDPDDAEEAVGVGADAIVVSNHGGRQLDGAVATVDALPPVAKRIAGRCTVFVDGGVRSGIDVLKMLTLGADGIFLGRAWVAALAAEGEQGIVDFLGTMQAELVQGLGMTGCRSVQEVERR